MNFRPAPNNKRQPVTCGLIATIKLTNGTQADYQRYLTAFEEHVNKHKVTSVTGQLPGVNQLVFNVKRLPAAGNNTADIQKQLDAVTKKTGLKLGVKIESCERTDIQPRVEAPVITKAVIEQAAKKIAKGSGLEIKSILVEFK